MIACPTCGKDTRVTETRTMDQYVRRRRVCSGMTCRTRATTYEILVAADDGVNKPLGDVILMPRRDLQDVLRALTSALATRHGNDAVVEMITAMLPTTTAKGTNDGNDHRADEWPTD